MCVISTHLSPDLPPPAIRSQLDFTENELASLRDELWKPGCNLRKLEEKLLFMVDRLTSCTQKSWDLLQDASYLLRHVQQQLELLEKSCALS